MNYYTNGKEYIKSFRELIRVEKIPTSFEHPEEYKEETLYLKPLNETWHEISEEEYNAYYAERMKVFEPTAEQKAERERLREIEELKAKLAATDYKCLKYVDGAITDEEYEEVKALRAEYRKKITELGG